MTASADVPELSLADWMSGDTSARGAFGAALFDGLKRFGFIILKDHEISADTLARAYRKSAEFFALPERRKMQSFAGADGQRGYTPFGREHAKDAEASDLKEFWHIGREFKAGDALGEIYKPNQWPAAPDGFRDAFLDLYDALEEAGLVMLDALEPSLELRSGYFRAMAENGNSILRLLHYPPVADDADPNAIRAAAHEDINLITILVSANGAGLELRSREGEWQAIETGPDNLIVDAGDMLARITNGVIPATTHRVVNPSGPNVSRYSMPFFMHPRPDAMLEVIPACRDAGEPPAPITADEFLRRRLKEIGLA